MRFVLALLLAAALCLQARAQEPGLTASTSSRDEPIFYRGECVGTGGQRNDGYDPCPRVLNYVGLTRDQVGNTEARHELQHWNLKDRARDVVLDQWPPARRIAGWPGKYAVLLLYGQKTADPEPKPLPLAPGVEKLPLAMALDRLRAEGWATNPLRVDGARVDPDALKAGEAEAPVLIQRPRPGEAGRTKAVDLYVLVAPPPPPSLRPVPSLIGRSERSAADAAAREGFVAKKADPGPQPDRRVEYQSPRANTLVAAGSTIEYLVAREAGKPVAPEPLPPPKCPVCNTCPDISPCDCAQCEKNSKTKQITEYKPVLVDNLVAQPGTVTIIGLGAGGAGAAGGYVLARFLRRRRQDEEDTEVQQVKDATVLRARVHVDRRGEQRVDPL